MDDNNPEQNRLSDHEREDQRLMEIFNANSPPPKTPPATDRAQILHHINSEPSLTTFRKNGLERFLANVGVMPDGRVVCTIPSLLDDSQHLLPPLLWGSTFGACIRILINTLRTPAQAVFIPGEKAFDALQSDRIIFASHRLGRIQAITEYDLSSSIKVKSAFQALMARCVLAHKETIDSDRYFISDPLVRANSVSPALCSNHWTRIEWLQRGWIKACDARYNNAVSLVKERQVDIARAGEISELDDNYALLRATILTLSQDGLSTSARVQEVINRYKSGRMTKLLVEGIWFEEEQTSIGVEPSQTFRRAREVAFELWNLLELDPKLSDWGRRQISWDVRKEIDPIEIDATNFAIQKNEDAAIYWECKRPEILAHRDQLLSASDLFLEVASFVDGMAKWHVDLNEDEAESTITGLLNEAVALREWTIPPNAYVEVSVGPFTGVEVTEVGDDVFFVWRTASDRYWDMSVDTEKQGFANTEVFTLDAANPLNHKSELAIRLLMSAIIRDFWVVTEREKIFGVKARRAERKDVEKRESRVVYLPRVRYLGSKLDLSRITLGLSYKQRSQHLVRPHFRKANPSQLQLEIAKRARKIVPEGHTYVQTHYRGVEGTEGQTVYRSRSAMALLFDADQSELNQPGHFSSTDWFGFERAVSILLEKNFNFIIVHRATRGKTDYGIDILATKTVGTQIETWIVQCKCYKPSNLVNPSHIRELVGSIADLQSDGIALVRGMMVTTSRISSDALKLALKHGIQCVGGDDLNSILSSINRNNDPLH